LLEVAVVVSSNLELLFVGFVGFAGVVSLFVDYDAAVAVVVVGIEF